jgi:nitrite reductase/ring-hydroxylating ferredoxin subunit
VNEREVVMTFAARTADVPNFGKKTVSINGTELLIINIKGQFFACVNECPHQGSPLAGGIVKDGVISCPRHGYRFNLKTGACSDAPGLVLKVYPTEVRGDELHVDIS